MPYSLTSSGGSRSMLMSNESFFSGSTTRFPPLPIRPRLTSPLRSQARCSSISRSHTAGSIRKSPTNCTRRCYPKKTGARRRPSLEALPCLEAVNHADEEDRHIGAVRRRDRLAVVRARQAAPGKARERVVLDVRVAEADRGALGEAVVVADVVLLRAVVAGARGTAGRTAGERPVNVIRLRIRGPDRALADRDCNAHTHLCRVAIARQGLVRHLLVRKTDVGKAEVPSPRHAPAGVGVADGGELLMRIVGRANPQPAA